MSGKKSKKIPKDTAPRNGVDLVISFPVDSNADGSVRTGQDRLTFDGYSLVWHGASPETFTAFSGQADRSAKESVQDQGPVPQGKYGIEPARIENTPSNKEAWGEKRVALEPYRANVDRMMNCFGFIRTNMYIHGGKYPGTIGCVEINDDSEEKAFFDKLKAYGKRIELEVKYTGERETEYEETTCPY